MDADPEARPLLRVAHKEAIPKRSCVPLCIDPVSGNGLGDFSLGDMARAVLPGKPSDVLPVLGWLPSYTKAQVVQDLAAGLTVGVMLIPQSMAYSILAGMPPIYGLYASTVPLLVYAAFASSTQLQVGTVATTAILLNSVVTALNPADEGGPDYIRLAVAVSFLAGCVQVAMGLLRFGFVANFLSWPVMSGFTSAAACIIFSSQVSHLFGVKLDPSIKTVHGKLGSMLTLLPDTHTPTLLLSLCSLAFLLGIKRVKVNGRPLPRWFPAQLILVVTGILLSYALDLGGTRGVATVGPVPAGLPTASWPIQSTEELAAILPGALILSIVSYVGSISLAVVFAKEVKQTVDANKELVALGLACILGSAWKSQVVSGSFTRTAVNNEMGSTSPMSGAFTAAFMVVSLVFLAPLFQYLPKAVLASMIVASLKSLVKYNDVVVFWKGNLQDLLQLLFSFFAVLLLGIDKGIVVAMGLSVSLVVLRSFRPDMSLLGTLPGTNTYVDLKRYPNASPVPGFAIVRIGGEVHFGNRKAVSEFLLGVLGPSRPTPSLSRLQPGSEPTDGGKVPRRRLSRSPSPGPQQAARVACVEALVLDGSAVTSIDASACQALNEVLSACKHRQVPVVCAAFPGPVRDTLERFLVGSPTLTHCLSVDDAVAAVDALPGDAMMSR